MLKSIRIQNYRSIKDCLLDLSFGEKKAPNGFIDYSLMPFIEENGQRCTSVLSLYGANGSGKSCIINAIHEVTEVIRNGVDDKLYHPNALSFCGGHTTVTFELTGSGKNLSYTICYDAVSILQEKLSVNGKVRFLSANNDIHSSMESKNGIYNEAKLRTIFRTECCSSSDVQVYSFVSKIGSNYQNLDREITSCFASLSSLMLVLPTNSLPLDPIFQYYLNVERIMNHQSDENCCKQRILEIVEGLDLSIKDIRFKKGHDSKGRDYYFDWEAAHADENGKTVWLDLLKDESNGTRMLFGLAAAILAILDFGGILIIDEIDQSLHSMLLIQLVRLFKDKRYNAKGAQLVCSLHNTDLLDSSILRVSDVGIITKNLKDGTMIKRLCQIDGVRNVTNFRKQYLEGLYAGIPYPYV